MEKATFAGGCFWCTEAIFQRLQGVTRVTSGYIGGHVDHPTYEQVCTGTTGHAEANEIEFDPDIISFETLLDIFFHLHDPTTKDRQGNDVGPQYRSAVFYHSPAQQAAVEKYVHSIPGAVTEIVPAGTFYPAEPYHQNYYNQHSNAPYCSLIIAPKVQKLLTTYAALTKKSADRPN